MSCRLLYGSANDQYPCDQLIESGERINYKFRDPVDVLFLAHSVTVYISMFDIAALQRYALT